MAQSSDMSLGGASFGAPWLIGYRRPLFWSEWWHLVDVDVAMREAAQR